MTTEAFGLSLRAREEGAAKAARARDAAARLAAKERGAAPLVCPEGANEQQRAAWHTAMGEIIVRERQSKIARGWQRIDKRTSPAGTVPLACLWGAKMVVLAIDLRGVVRLVEGGKASTPITISEAVAIAAGR